MASHTADSHNKARRNAGLFIYRDVKYADFAGAKIGDAGPNVHKRATPVRRQIISDLQQSELRDSSAHQILIVNTLVARKCFQLQHHLRLFHRIVIFPEGFVTGHANHNPMYTGPDS